MKILAKVIYNRISSKPEAKLDPLHYSFRPKVGTIESIAALKTILANRIIMQKDTCLCFIDFQKASDRVEHDILLDCLIKRRANNKDAAWSLKFATGKLGSWEMTKCGCTQ